MSDFPERISASKGGAAWAWGMERMELQARAGAAIEAANYHHARAEKWRRAAIVLAVTTAALSAVLGFIAWRS